jgi:hypothetical protein
VGICKLGLRTQQNKVPVSMRRDPRDLRGRQRRKQPFNGGASIMEREMNVRH